MENIRYGRPDATDEEVIEAAKMAHADHFIRTLPEGYDMVINEEATNISQGEKQLLTIARAVLADPKILILDEATSSVDTRTEVLIQKAMDELMQGPHQLHHRAPPVHHPQRRLILVMNDGDIVEQGNHEELLAANGFYAELYNSQFEYAKVNNSPSELYVELLFVESGRGCATQPQDSRLTAHAAQSEIPLPNRAKATTPNTA